MSDYETWQARCSAGHPDAHWSATPTGGADYTCADCQADTPAIPVLIAPTAWGWIEQRRRRWVDSDGRALL